jgi:aspartyl/asparaginyl beta-hydroxylase (cupin superfamily)
MSGSAPDPILDPERSREQQTRETLIGYLDSAGAAELPHGERRALLDHLIGTYEVVRRWKQPVLLQQVALIHSVYGTDVYQRQLLPLSRRGELREIAGEEVERLAYLFSVTPREPLLAGTHLWAPGVSTSTGGATREDLDALVLLHMANLAEQAHARDGSPGLWLTRLRELGELLIASEAVALPLFIAELAALSEEDELIAGRAYRAGLSELHDPETKADQLALASAVCPVVAEPCIWLAYRSWCRRDLAMATRWAEQAARRLLGLGTAWDKRLAFDEWLALTQLLAHPDRELPSSAEAIVEPRGLFEALTGLELLSRPRPSLPKRDPAAATQRFGRYIEGLSEDTGSALGRIYPDLESRPWYDPADFPLANYLRTNFEAIRKEIVALEPARFHPESERIERTGDWDVAFLYERGRRRDDVCDACPVTAHGIETHAAMRTMTGLVYVSRMRAGTHIAPHRGPTNLRLRCHLGVEVPDGDCAIRVAEQTERWREGECLVFDDYFEHEAWNRTAEDRIVLIVDLWHPDLSATEVQLLEGLHRYAYAQARQLNRYWSSNAAAARRSLGGSPAAGRPASP